MKHEKGNDKAESSQAPPKVQSSQAKAQRPNVIVGLASQYKNLATNYVENKFGTRTDAEGSKIKGKRRVGVKKLVMHRLGQLLRNYKMKQREKYILPNLNTPSKLNELPSKYSAIVKAEEWVEFVNYTTTNAYKEKLARCKMAHPNNIINRTRWICFCKEKMIENKEIKPDDEPPRGIMWLKGRVNKDGEFLDDEIISVGDKLKEDDDKIKEGTLNVDDGTDAMIVTPMAINNTDISAYEVDETQLSVVVRDKDARIQKKSNGLVTLEKVMETMSDGKQMLHNQALPNDCYKVSIDSSLVDAACILDVGNNGLKTIKDGVGGFFAWLKNQVVLDEEAVRHMYSNPMIQPEPEVSTQGYPLFSVEVL
nr:hypothetical protein [Tanacetum cinerariifolium]